MKYIIIMGIIAIMAASMTEGLIFNPYTILDVSPLESVNVIINFTNKEDIFCLQGGNCTLTSLVVNGNVQITGNITNVSILNVTEIIGINETIIEVANATWNHTDTNETPRVGDLWLNVSDFHNHTVDTNASTGCDDGSHLDGDGTCKDTNATIDARLVSTTFLPINYTTISGTENGGNNVQNLSFDDGQIFNITEANGINPLEVRINFTGVTGIPDWITMEHQYIGTHEILLQVWSYGESEWETYDTITQQAGMIKDSIPLIDGADHVSGGIIQTRFIHPANGVQTHEFFIDFINIIDGFSTITTTEHDGLSGRNNESNHLWALAKSQGYSAIAGNKTDVYNAIIGNITLIIAAMLGNRTEIEAGIVANRTEIEAGIVENITRVDSAVVGNRTQILDLVWDAILGNATNVLTLSWDAIAGNRTEIEAGVTGNFTLLQTWIGNNETKHDQEIGAVNNTNNIIDLGFNRTGDYDKRYLRNVSDATHINLNITDFIIMDTNAVNLSANRSCFFVFAATSTSRFC